jgi:hypothetical protein
METVGFILLSFVTWTALIIVPFPFWAWVMDRYSPLDWIWNWIYDHLPKEENDV